MNKGTIQVIYGEGNGRTTTAFGVGMEALTKTRTVIMIQFLKGCAKPEALEFLKGLEPEMKVFRFEKSERLFEELSSKQQEEELMNIRNSMNFAKKVVSTGECDVLILDDILGLLDQEIMKVEELVKFLQSKVEQMEVVLTGKVFPKELEPFVDQVLKINQVKVDNTIE